MQSSPVSYLGCKKGFELNLNFKRFETFELFGGELSNFFELSNFHRTFFQQFSENLMLHFGKIPKQIGKNTANILQNSDKFKFAKIRLKNQQNFQRFLTKN